MPGFEHARIADRLTCYGMQVAITDVVLFRGAAGCVLACAMEGQSLFVVVDEWLRVAQISEHSSAWRAAKRHAVWPADKLEMPIAWYAEAGSWVVVV